MHIYIAPFWLGIAATLITELALLITCVVLHRRDEKRGR